MAQLGSLVDQAVYTIIISCCFADYVTIDNVWKCVMKIALTASCQQELNRSSWLTQVVVLRWLKARVERNGPLPNIAMSHNVNNFSLSSCKQTSPPFVDQFIRRRRFCESQAISHNFFFVNPGKIPSKKSQKQIYALWIWGTGIGYWGEVFPPTNVAGLNSRD